MTNEIAQTSTVVTDLVRSGEAVYESLTGQEMSAVQQKVADTCSLFIDELLPAAERRVSFDLAGVLAGTTAALNGFALIIHSAKTVVANDNAKPANSVVK